MHSDCNMETACVKPNSAELILIDFKSVKCESTTSQRQFQQSELPKILCIHYSVDAKIEEP